MSDSARTIQLRRKDGAIIAELPAYPSLYQVPLNRYIDFIKGSEPFDDKGAVERGEVNVARVMAKSVGEFFGVPLEDILQAEYGTVEDSPGGGLQSLYVWIVNLIGTFEARIRKPEDCFFDYKGERYTIPIIGLQTLASLPLLPNLEVGQMVEAYEIKRIAQRTVDKTKDPDGSGLYSYYLQLLSVLALKDGEKLPFSESEVDVFINNRLLHFAEIDAGTALDVDFFLAASMRPSALTGAAVGTLSNHAFDLVRRIVPRGRLNRKHSTRRQSTRKKSLKKSDTGKSTSNSLIGRGLQKRVKVPSNRQKGPTL